MSFQTAKDETRNNSYSLEFKVDCSSQHSKQQPSSVSGRNGQVLMITVRDRLMKWMLLRSINFRRESFAKSGRLH